MHFTDIIKTWRLPLGILLAMGGCGDGSGDGDGGSGTLDGGSGGSSGSSGSQSGGGPGDASGGSVAPDAGGMDGGGSGGADAATGLGPDECLWPGTILLRDHGCNSHGWVTVDSKGNTWADCSDSHMLRVDCQTAAVELALKPVGAEGNWYAGISPEDQLVLWDSDGTYWVDTTDLIPPGTWETHPGTTYVDGRGHTFLVTEVDPVVPGDPETSHVKEYDGEGSLLFETDLEYPAEWVRGPIAEGLYIKASQPRGSCGDGEALAPELCDTADLNGGCGVLGGSTSGTITCRSDCYEYDATGCDSYDAGLCDNGALDNEICDPGVPLTETCVGLGLPGGVLACNATCDGYDVSGCRDGVYRLSGGEHKRVGPRWPEPNPPGTSETTILTRGDCGDKVMAWTREDVDGVFEDMYFTVLTFALDGSLEWTTERKRIGGGRRTPRGYDFTCAPDGDLLGYFGYLSMDGSSNAIHSRTMRWTQGTGNNTFDETWGERKADAPIKAEPFGEVLSILRTSLSQFELVRWTADMELRGEDSPGGSPGGAACGSWDLGTSDIQVTSQCINACTLLAEQSAPCTMTPQGCTATPEEVQASLDGSCEILAAWDPSYEQKCPACN